ncbi:helix-turn-helix transcriptional regulator [Caulobacter segnis]|uniref:helix-turn-helix domain-containing protein n=1 Tax=Caulobacter segnis TaxID=88688 RepID=UPI0024102769|nr:helix-turn-helix transcriptional regulator [Caulobacter segnis]MDG2520519.1 helix-turn-helix transcriptional regulator [Caulobacter segnis]
MEWRAVVGGNLRDLRVSRGWTQEELAFSARLDEGYLGKIERGKRNPSVAVLARLATALDATLADFFHERGLDAGGIIVPGEARTFRCPSCGWIGSQLSPETYGSSAKTKV